MVLQRSPAPTARLLWHIQEFAKALHGGRPLPGAIVSATHVSVPVCVPAPRRQHLAQILHLHALPMPVYLLRPAGEGYAHVKWGVRLRKPTCSSSRACWGVRTGRMQDVHPTIGHRAALSRLL